MTSNGTSATKLRQHWLSRMQIINWGVFDEYHDIRFSRGGTLLTGASGAGKSSLLDALSVAFLSQRRRNFNASSDKSAGGGGSSSQRSVDKYIRGMIGDVQGPNGRMRKKYLRETGPVWSAIAVTYTGTDGSVVTGLVLKQLGADQVTDATSTYAIIHDDVDIRDVCNTWAVNGFSRSVIDNAGWQCRRKDEGWYLDTLYGAIGLTGASAALDLLGKAKSLKSVGDLEEFVREYMLDEPDSLKELHVALEQINPLVQAREALSVARRKLELLKNIDEVHRSYVSESARLSTIDLLEERTVRAWVERQQLEQIPHEVERLDGEIDRIGAESQSIRDRQRALDGRRRDIFNTLARINGDLTPLRVALDAARERSEKVRNDRDQYEKILWDLDLSPALTSEEFQMLLSDSITEIGALDAKIAAQKSPIHDAHVAVGAAKDQVQRTARDLTRVEQLRSTVPENEDRMRGEIARAIGVDPAQLPYVCELMDLRPERARWRKAVEKVLRGTGLALLVPERHHKAVLRFVNEHNMRGYLRLEKVTADLPVSDPPTNTLAGCLALVEPRHECARAASHLVASQGDYILVDSTEEFAYHRRAVTDEGLRKESERRSVKDDKFELRASDYIYQGNIADKIAALRADLAAAEERYRVAEEALSAHERELGALGQAKELWLKLSRFDQFSKIDVASAESDEQALQLQLDTLMAENPDLVSLEDQAAKYEQQIEELGDQRARLDSRITAHDERRTALLELQEMLNPDEVGEHSRTAIESFLPDMLRPLELLDSGPYISELWRSINRDQEQLKRSVNGYRRELDGIVTSFDGAFPEAIPNDSSDLDEKVNDYVALWRRIKDREVAEAHEKMLLLITEQAPQAILRLYQLADDEEQRIHAQIDRVNVGLASVDFAPGTILKLCADGKHISAAMEFTEIAKRISGRIPAVSSRDPEAVNAQYKDILELRNRIASDSSEYRRWTADALDVRNRFTFYCAEYDKSDLLIPKQTFTNATAKSGGEQEKLMAFCLAGALSYNLADHDSGDSRPVFAQLMIDEAFSKSDPDFARQSLSAFARFGFQLVIVATVQNTTIIQPHIDSVVMVSKNKTDRASTQTVPVHRLTELREEQKVAAVALSAG